ncbi:MAG TPA: biotin-dependent carboxyltransferase family protein [Acidobacteriota bacterium]
MIEILQPGLTTIQDLGRTGWESSGMPRSGAFDPFLARVANQLAGNSHDTALLEFALAGPSLRFDKSVRIALAGFTLKYILNGIAVPEFRSFKVEAGEELRFKGMDGWFGYLAVSGGIQIQKILGSASTYAAAGIFGRLKSGDRLQCGEMTERSFAINKDLLQLPKNNVAPILEAAHSHLFNEHSKVLISSEEYKLTLQSDRMGARLEGTAIEVPEIKRSVPTLPGVIQIARSGQPIILGPEGPVTGGYPQIGILSQASWTTLASIQPGKTIRFQWLNLERAKELQNQRNQLFSNTALWEPL